MINNTYTITCPNRNVFTNIIRKRYSGQFNDNEIFTSYEHDFIFSQTLHDAGGLPAHSHKKTDAYKAFKILKKLDKNTVIFHSLRPLNVTPKAPKEIHFCKQQMQAFDALDKLDAYYTSQCQTVSQQLRIIINRVSALAWGKLITGKKKLPKGHRCFCVKTHKLEQPWDVYYIDANFQNVYNVKMTKEEFNKRSKSIYEDLHYLSKLPQISKYITETTYINTQVDKLFKRTYNSKFIK